MLLKKFHVFISISFDRQSLKKKRNFNKWKINSWENWWWVFDVLKEIIACFIKTLCISIFSCHMFVAPGLNSTVNIYKIIYLSFKRQKWKKKRRFPDGEKSCITSWWLVLYKYIINKYVYYTFDLLFDVNFFYFLIEKNQRTR